MSQRYITTDQATVKFSCTLCSRLVLRCGGAYHPGMGASCRPQTAADALESPISDLIDHHLEVRCSCHKAMVPIRTIAARPGWRNRALVDAVNAMHCRQCRSRPNGVVLTDRADGAVIEAAHLTWRVDLYKG